MLMIDIDRKAWHILRSCALTATTLALIANGCAKQSAEPRHIATPETLQSSQVRQVLTLPSGYRLKVIQVGPLYSTTAHRNIGIMLAYETDIPLGDVKSLSHEADGIFKYFHVDADRWGYSSAILSATEPAQGFLVSQSDGFRFIFQRDKSGAWRRTQPSAK